MKSIRIYFVLASLVIAGTLISACTGAIAASSWPGVSANQDDAFVAYSTMVMAARLTDAGLAWKFPADKPDNARHYYAPPVFAGNQLIVGDYLNTLHSLDVTSGAEKWKFEKAQGRWIGSPLVINNTILAPNADDSLYALDLNGNKLWSFATKGPLWSQPVSDGNNIYFTSLDHNLYALQLSNGSQLWKTDMGAAVLNSPTLSSDGVLYVGTLAKEMIAVDASSGKILKRYKTDGELWSSPVLNGSALNFGDRTGSVYALDAKTMAPLWKTSLGEGGAIYATGVVFGDGVVFVTENGQVISFGAKGEKLWTRTINGKLYSTPVVAGDKLIVPITPNAAGDKLLQAYDTKGNESWSFVPPK
jgi:outer membrane protein assembly factor BamB